jgi:uncharacterized protein involved in outer membrane biogenesis
VILAVLIIGVSILRDTIIKKSIENIVFMTTGLKLDIGQLKISLPRSFVSIKDLKVLNPKKFEDRTMLTMPEIYIDYDLLPLLKREVRLREARIDVKEFMVVKNFKGETNLEHIKGMSKTTDKKKEDEKSSAAPSNISIDELSLKIGKVVYKDYSSGGKAAVSEYNINIDSHYKNVKNPGEILKIIVAKALMNTALGRLTDFNELKNMPAGILDEGAGAVKSTIDGLKNVIKSPF